MARTVRPEPAGSDSDVPPKSHHASGKKSKSGDKKRKGSSSGPAGASKGKRAKKDSLGKSAGLRASKSLKTEVMTVIPTLKTIQESEKYRAFPSFKAQLDDQSMVEFKKNQAVYVLPDPSTMEIPTDYPDQSQYWIAIVKDIRAKSRQDPTTEEWTADPSDVFVVVEWFYKPADIVTGTTTKAMVETVKEADQYFGVKEIIRSDDKSVISVFSCCEPVAIYEFHDNAKPDEPTVTLMEDPSESQEDDHESDSGRTDPEEHPNPLFAAHVNYFYRLTLPLKSAARKASSKKKNKVLDGPASTLAKHCVCEQPYSPSIDIMRYCTSCQKWYHHECATPSTGHPEYPFKAPVDAPDELLQIARMPIVRGGVWGVGGNINIVYNARELLRAAYDNDTNLDNWEEDLTLNGLEEWREWIKYMEKKKKNGEPIWETEAKVFYQCPVCDYSI